MSAPIECAGAKRPGGLLGGWGRPGPLVAAIVGVLLSLGASALVWKAEHRQDEAEYRIQVAQFRSALGEHRIVVQDLLLTLRSLFHFVPQLEYRQFHDSITNLGIRTGGVQAFVWAPWVPGARLTEFEARVRQQGLPQFRVIEGDITHPATDRPLPVTPRDGHLPILFLDSEGGNELLVGYDLLSLEPFGAYVRQARDTGNLTISPPLKIPYRGGVVDGFIAAVPVYRSSLRPDSGAERMTQFQGCVLAGFVFQDVLDWIAGRTPQRDLDIMLVELQPDGSERVLYSRRAGAEHRGGPDLTLAEMKRSSSAPMKAGIAERTWFFYFRRGQNWNHPLQFWAPFSLLLAGLLVTSLLTRQLAEADRRAAVVERLVGERTAELAAANRQLEAEAEVRRQAERTLGDERNLLRTLLDRLPDAVFVADLAGRYLMLNDVQRRWLDLSSEDEALGRSVLEVGAGNLAAAFHQGTAEVAACGTPELYRDVVVDSGKGGRRHLSVSRLPLRNPEGVVDRVLVLTRDITETRRAEEERLELERHLQESQKLESLGLLAGGIAHDFNNLLTTAMGNVGLARMDLPPGSPVVAHLDQIQTMTRRAADLCRQLLAYSGKGRLVTGHLDLNRLIREIRELIRLSVSKKVTVQLQLASELPGVSGDATQLRQVLMNLVMNAAEAIGDVPGEVRLTTSVRSLTRTQLAETTLGVDLDEGDYLCVEVSDNGSGMTSETVARMFDPFFTTKFLGRGLGLAAVLGITRQHKGAIQVASAPGVGTTFRLYLPASAGTPTSDATPQTPLSAWRGSGTLLVVDDEETVRVIAARILERVGFTVEQAVDGRDGADRFAADPDRYRGVVLDLTMPRLNGEETLREIRQLRRDTPVLLMSGYTSHDASRRFAGLGLDGFLEKPFGADQLVAAVHGLFDPSARRSEI